MSLSAIVSDTLRAGLSCFWSTSSRFETAELLGSTTCRKERYSDESPAINFLLLLLIDG